MIDTMTATDWVEKARAVEPLERTSEWEAGELPETYPWAV